MDEKYKIHIFYIISILLTIIVLLITVKWSNIEGLKDYISFALTVFSLGLAVLAIIYSMYSNSSLSTNLNLLESSSQKLSLTSDSLKNSTKNLSENILQIPFAIEKVESRVLETHTLVQNLKLSSSNVSNTSELSDHLPKEFLDDFTDRTSYNSLITLYVLLHSYTNNVSIQFDERLLGKMAVEDEYNFTAFVIMKAMGLFNVVINDSSYLCTDFHSYYKTNLELIIKNKNKKLFKGREDMLAQSEKGFNDLKDYLNEYYK